MAHPSTVVVPVTREGRGAANAVAAVVLAAAAFVFAYAAAVGLTGSSLAGPAVAVVLAAVTGWGWSRRPMVAVDEGHPPRALRTMSLLASLLALAQLARLAVFMVDPSQTACSQFPGSGWETAHSCVTAYYVAAREGTASIYHDDLLYTEPGGDPTRPRVPRRLGPFNIDVYEYPPPFLLLTRALYALVPDFASYRMTWFGLNGLLVVAAMLAVCRFLPPPARARAVLFLPLAWAGLATWNAVQKGNVQLLVIALSMLAMVLFARGRPAAGGALLAFAIVSKLYPGLLVLYLLVRRQWRAVGWTAAFGLLYLVAALIDLGWTVFAGFLAHLPKLLGGEAFPVFRNPAGTAINLSIPGLVFKLKLFGVPGMSFPAAKIVGWIYTVVAVAATVIAARRAQRHGETPVVWLAIILLATLRSPFLPQGYGIFPALWLLTLLAATAPPSHRMLMGVVAAWALLNVYTPLDAGIPPRWMAVTNLVPQALAVALAVIALRRPGVEVNTSPAPRPGRA